MIRHIGKEANEIEETAAGLIAADDVTASYAHPHRDVYYRLVLPALQDFPVATVAESAGLPGRTINGLRGGRRPDHRTVRRLVPALARLCAAATLGIDHTDHLSVLAA